MLKGFSISAPRRSLEELQQQIQRQSPQEKARTDNDLYGKLQEQTIKETPRLLHDSLEALEKCMQTRVRAEDKKTYTRAQVECPDLVNDPAFRLLFLRSEQFHVQNAAARLAAYWNAKIEIWGEELAFQEIKLTHFDPEDQTALAKGGFRLLPKKDDAGRGIILVDRSRFDQRTTHRRSMHKLLWYIHHAAIADIEVQRQGIVYVVGSPRRPTSLLDQDRKMDAKCIRYLQTALPVRIVGIHHYLSRYVLAYVVPLLLALFDSHLRMRYVYHNKNQGGDEGSFLEALETYRIPKSALPADMGGSSTFQFQDWLEQRSTADL